MSYLTKLLGTAFGATARVHALSVADTDPRTLADLDGADTVGRIHLAEAISWRMTNERQARAA